MILQSKKREKEKQKTEESMQNKPGRVLSGNREASHEVIRGSNPLLRLPISFLISR